MKIWVILIALLIIPISIAKDVDIPEVFKVEKAIKFQDSETTYFYAGSKLLASKNGEEITYQYQDRLGSDTNAKNLPFGQLLKIENRFSFTGKELDNDLYYFGARYYDPNLGRFSSVDPVKDNLPYAYVNNNPMNYIDPTGMDDVQVFINKLENNIEDEGVLNYFRDNYEIEGNTVTFFGEAEEVWDVGGKTVSDKELRNMAFGVTSSYTLYKHRDDGLNEMDARIETYVEIFDIFWSIEHPFVIDPIKEDLKFNLDGGLQVVENRVQRGNDDEYRLEYLKETAPLWYAVLKYKINPSGKNEFALKEIISEKHNIPFSSQSKGGKTPWYTWLGIASQDKSIFHR